MDADPLLSPPLSPSQAASSSLSLCPDGPSSISAGRFPPPARMPGCRDLRSRYCSAAVGREDWCIFSPSASSAASPFSSCARTLPVSAAAVTAAVTPPTAACLLFVFSTPSPLPRPSSPALMADCGCCRRATPTPPPTPPLPPPPAAVLLLRLIAPTAADAGCKPPPVPGSPNSCCCCCCCCLGPVVMPLSTSLVDHPKPSERGPLLPNTASACLPCTGHSTITLGSAWSSDRFACACSIKNQCSGFRNPMSLHITTTHVADVMPVKASRSSSMSRPATIAAVRLSFVRCTTSCRCVGRSCRGLYRSSSTRRWYVLGGQNPSKWPWINDATPAWPLGTTADPRCSTTNCQTSSVYIPGHSTRHTSSRRNSRSENAFVLPSLSSSPCCPPPPPPPPPLLSLLLLPTLAASAVDDAPVDRRLRDAEAFPPNPNPMPNALSPGDLRLPSSSSSNPSRSCGCISSSDGTCSRYTCHAPSWENSESDSCSKPSTLLRRTTSSQSTRPASHVGGSRPAGAAAAAGVISDALNAMLMLFSRDRLPCRPGDIGPVRLSHRAGCGCWG